MSKTCEHDFSNELSEYCRNGCGLSKWDFWVDSLVAENKDLREALEKSAVLCLKPINTGDVCDARLLMESTLAKYKKDSE
jgi:hypothetical protein